MQIKHTLSTRETYTRKETAPPYIKINGFQLACHDDHPKYGITIYLCEDVSSYTIIPPTKINDTSIIGVNVGRISIYST